jgi:D-alanine transaminase
MHTPTPHTPCYLDGHWLPLSEAKVSVLDRCFLLGDGIYEVIPVYGQQLFRFQAHMARLERSLHATRIPNPHSRDEWRALLQEQVRRYAQAQDAQDQLLYLQISRGVAPRQHAMPAGLQPSVFMMSQTPDPGLASLQHEGVACVTARDFRWERCDIKTTSLQGSVLARQIAVDHGAFETILLRDLPGGGGPHVSEGAACNVWIVLEGALIGVPPSLHTLEGLRIELLGELAEECGIACHLLSSAAVELMPVARLDGEPVGHGSTRGRPGPVYARLHEAYERAKRSPTL